MEHKNFLKLAEIVGNLEISLDNAFEDFHAREIGFEKVQEAADKVDEVYLIISKAGEKHFDGFPDGQVLDALNLWADRDPGFTGFLGDCGGFDLRDPSEDADRWAVVEQICSDALAELGE